MGPGLVGQREKVVGVRPLSRYCGSNPTHEAVGVASDVKRGSHRVQGLGETADENRRPVALGLSKHAERKVKHVKRSVVVRPQEEKRPAFGDELGGSGVAELNAKLFGVAARHLYREVGAVDESFEEVPNQHRVLGGDPLAAGHDAGLHHFDASNDLGLLGQAEVVHVHVGERL